MMRLSGCLRPRGGRVALREIVPADADGPWLGWMRDAEVVRWTEARFAEHSRESLAAYAGAMLESPTSLFLAIEDETGRHIGNIKLGPLHATHRYASIGVIIGDRAAWGRGYATEAVASLAEYAFGTLGLHKLTVGSVAANAGSVRVFEKAGFVVEGVRKAHQRYDGAWHDIVYLGRVNPDWREEE